MKTNSLLKEPVSMLFLFYTVLFCVCLMSSNVLETKQISLGMFNITGGLLVFPISYIINDCMCEVWGFRRARQLIWLGFAMNFIFVSFGGIVDAIPGAAYWQNEEGFHAVFGLAPRIAGASFLAFLTGSFVNAYIMSKMKLSSQGKHFSLRAIVSTLGGETVDSLIFFPLALYGVVPNNEIPELILTQIVLKTMYEVAVLPVTRRVVRLTKQHEHTDVYDYNEQYRVFKF